MTEFGLEFFHAKIVALDYCTLCHVKTNLIVMKEFPSQNQSDVTGIQILLILEYGNIKFKYVTSQNL